MSQAGGTSPADDAKMTANKRGDPEAKTTPHIKTTAEPRIRDLQNDPARTGFDPARAWWLNYLAILTGRITAEGTFHYREWRYAVNEARDCHQCERWRDFALRYSPTVRFLADKIADLNGRIDSTNVYCRRCPARLDEDGTVYRQGGGFSPEHGILICANEVIDRKHLEDTLAHEMVHAWDALRWKVDYTGERNLRHAACTEIRASMLSGECRWWRWGTIARAQGDTTIAKQFQKCVRTRAMLSVMARPTCRDAEHAARLVDQVWDSCFADTRPFDEVDR